MKIHQLSPADAIASLNSNPQGLSSVEAERRLGEYGFNRVEEVARESILLRLPRPKWMRGSLADM